MEDDKSAPTVTHHDGPNGRIAALRREGRGPGLVWLGGYASDMRGSKAEAVDTHAEARGLACLRFDYSGHGESEGAFADGTIGSWAADAASALTALTDGPQILIGSSMGAWIALLLLERMPEKFAGLILIAPAPDFVTDLIPTRWPPRYLETLRKDGILELPSEYDDSVMVYTRALFEDGERQRVFARTLRAPCPVRIVSGTADEVVPVSHVVKLTEHLIAEDMTTTLVKDGDHRLSTPRDLDRLRGLIDELAG